MHKLFLLGFVLFIAVTVKAQNISMYVAIKSGLNIREKPGVSAKVIDKIPYATKVSINPFEESDTLRTEGLLGYWRKVTYNNKTGYILDSYLFPMPPPKATVKTMKDYLLQLTTPFGNKLVVKSRTQNTVEEGDWQLDKQLYKNGSEWHQYSGYEYMSDTYIIPGFTTQQAFLLVRLIPEFEAAFGTKEEFPLENKIYKKGEHEYELTVEKEMLGNTPWIKKIKVEFEEGALYFFELYQLENQIVIFYGSGV
jgi:uncharacterized protein YgiM (DUF1202 family)